MAKEDGKMCPENGPTITPDMIKLVHQTLEKRGLLYYSEGGVYVPTEKGWRLLTEIKPVTETVSASGSHGIIATCTHSIGLTKSESVHADGKDCMIGVKADKSCKELGDEFRDSLKGGRKVKITIEADGVSDSFEAFGSPALSVSDEEGMVIRKDDFIDDKVVAIMADKSASDLSKELIEKLKKSDTKVTVFLTIQP